MSRPVSSSPLIFVLGNHPALSAAELLAYTERIGLQVSWDISRLPIALLGTGDFPSPAEIQNVIGGTTMMGTLRATREHLPTAAELISLLPELLAPRQGKRLISLSAIATRTKFPSQLAEDVRRLAMDLKRQVGLKGTRVVFPSARRADLSTAQLLHNDLPRNGTAIVLLVADKHVDRVTLDAIQDIEAYARRDRGRPEVDPGRGMLPPKVAQMLLNLSRVPPGGVVYDPFCGVGTIPTEALLMGFAAIASDRSPRQVERTKKNLVWLAKAFPTPYTQHPTPENIFVHDIRSGAPTLARQADVIVTEGWLGPSRTTPPLPHEVTDLFDEVRELLKQLLRMAGSVVKPSGRVVVTVPALRVKGRTFRFSTESIKVRAFVLEPLVPKEWLSNPLFREAAQGTLLYGRPDAIVLRDILRFRRR